MRLRTRSSVDLPQPDGPMNEVTLPLVAATGSTLFSACDCAVKEIAGRASTTLSCELTAGSVAGSGWFSWSSLFVDHLLVSRVAARTRAAMLSARTANVMISAPVQASCCHSL